MSTAVCEFNEDAFGALFGAGRGAERELPPVAYYLSNWRIKPDFSSWELTHHREFDTVLSRRLLEGADGHAGMRVHVGIEHGPRGAEFAVLHIIDADGAMAMRGYGDDLAGALQAANALMRERSPHSGAPFSSQEFDGAYERRRRR